MLAVAYDIERVIIDLRNTLHIRTFELSEEKKLTDQLRQQVALLTEDRNMWKRHAEKANAIAYARE